MRPRDRPTYACVPSGEISEGRKARWSQRKAALLNSSKYTYIEMRVGKIYLILLLILYLVTDKLATYVRILYEPY